MGASTSFFPKVDFMISAIMSCPSSPQCTSAEIMIGYGEVTKAYLSIASQMSRKGTLEVKVFPCVITGSSSPSYISTKEDT